MSAAQILCGVLWALGATDGASNSAPSGPRTIEILVAGPEAARKQVDAALRPLLSGASDIRWTTDEKLPTDVKEDVQADVDALKTALAGEDDDAVKTAFDKLNESQTKLGEALYAADQAGEDAAASGAAADESSDEDVVDAEVVEDEEDAK